MESAQRKAEGPEPVGIAWIDTHAHLTSDRFRDDLEAVLGRAGAAGVEQIVSAATTARDSAETLDLASRWQGVHPAVAVHPNEVAEAEAGDWERIVALSGDSRVVAIGETGLDRYWDRAAFPLQQEWFDRHLELARQRQLPIIIHCRDAYVDVIDQLRALGRPVRGVLHSFTGTTGDAEALLELGLHLSFAGMVTFANRSLDALRAVATVVPEDRLLVETDAPYLSPHPHRGKRNEPAHVLLTGETVARSRGLDTGELARITTRNARVLFGLESRSHLDPMVLPQAP